MTASEANCPHALMRCAVRRLQPYDISQRCRLHNNGRSRHQFPEQWIRRQFLPAVAVRHLIEDNGFLAGRALRQMVYQHLLPAIGMQRLRE